MQTTINPISHRKRIREMGASELEQAYKTLCLVRRTFQGNPITNAERIHLSSLCMQQYRQLTNGKELHQTVFPNS